MLFASSEFNLNYLHEGRIYYTAVVLDCFSLGSLGSSLWSDIWVHVYLQ